MAVSPGYRAFVVEQLNRVAPVTGRSMFGGLGLYCRGLFFALADDDRLYFTVNDSSRPEFEARGMGPFRPFPHRPDVSMAYYEVPGDVLEDVETLGEWTVKALGVARARKAARGTRAAPKGRKKAR